VSEEKGIDSHKLNKAQLIARIAELEEELAQRIRSRDFMKRILAREKVMVEALHGYIERGQ
jgi:hypothetical protein